jgi:hypothetical protein
MRFSASDEVEPLQSNFVDWSFSASFEVVPLRNGVKLHNYRNLRAGFSSAILNGLPGQEPGR